MEEEKSRAVELAVSKAQKEWNSRQSFDIADQIAAAKREWIRDHNDELEKRLANAIEEVRRIWDEEQKLKAKEVMPRNRKSLNVYIDALGPVFLNKDAFKKDYI